MKFIIFSIRKIIIMFQVYGSLWASAKEAEIVIFKAWKWILYNLLRQWNCSDDFSITLNRLRQNSRHKKWFWNGFFSANCGNFSFEFCTFSFFLFDLVTNKVRKLENVESNLIIEKVLSSLPLSVLAGVSFLLAHV